MYNTERNFKLKNEIYIRIFYICNMAFSKNLVGQQQLFLKGISSILHIDVNFKILLVQKIEYLKIAKIL